MKQKAKRTLAALLTLMMCMGVFPAGLTAAAASTGTVYLVGLPRASDPNQSGWGHGDMSFLSGWSMSAATATSAKAVGGYESDTVYCIEPGVNLAFGDTLSEKGEDFWDSYPSSLNQTITPDEIKELIGRIFQYGWTGKNNLNWNSTNSTHAEEMGEMLATQYLIWECVVGERDSDFNKVDATAYGKDNIMDMVSSSHPLRSQILSHYNRIAASVKTHMTIPSFMERSASSAQTAELTWDGTRYSVTLTDSNSVLSDYTFSSGTSGISFSVSGNKLTIQSDSPPSGTISITAQKTAARKGVIVWGDGLNGGSNSSNIQDLVAYDEAKADTITAYLKAKVSVGNLNLIKTSEDGIVADIPFNISGNGINRDVTTGQNGEILIENLTAGTYTVTEGAIDRYVPQESRTVTVIAGQTVSVDFSNVLKNSASR